jgi:hypothetical protein
MLLLVQDVRLVQCNMKKEGLNFSAEFLSANEAAFDAYVCPRDLTAEGEGTGSIQPPWFSYGEMPADAVDLTFLARRPPPRDILERILRGAPARGY